MNWKRLFIDFLPTWLVVAAIFYLSLAHVSAPRDMPLFPNADKVVHALMYAGLTGVFCFDVFRHFQESTFRRRLLWFGVISAAVLGGLVEVAQKYLTTYRSGDWWDLLADLLGVFIGWVCGVSFVRRVAEWLLSRRMK